MKLKNSGIMLLRQLDKKLQEFKIISKIEVPPKGWINATRSILNMSMRQLGSRLNMSAQGIKDLENREQEGTITLKALRQAGEGFNMKLVYGFAPIDSSLENMLEMRASELAQKILNRVNTTMQLEDQQNSADRNEQAFIELKEQIKREMSKSIWD